MKACFQSLRPGDKIHWNNLSWKDVYTISVGMNGQLVANGERDNRTIVVDDRTFSYIQNGGSIQITRAKP